MMWIALSLLFIVIVGAITLVVLGLRESRGGDTLSRRLAEYAERGEITSLEEIELSQPFMERVVYPAAQRFGELAQRFTPQNAITETRRQLDMAGTPRWLEPTVFLASRLIFGLGLGALMFFVFSLSPTTSPFALTSMLITGGSIFIGFFLPNMLLNRSVRRRQSEVTKAMPDAMDLLTICVEAGLGFDAAMRKVVEKWDNDLARAFGRVLQEIQLGKLRREALRDMSARLGVDEINTFVAAVIQSEQLGVSMARVLRVQSDAMRVKRRQRAEENAQKAPVKMLLPMAFLIFPTIMIILLGPAVLQIMRSGAFF
ncbi:MAG: type II secretion system F family protein [Anaerolineales bacterium]|nr:MAG: type II secretion system F family protein [Anaerolineales bacterium]